MGMLLAHMMENSLDSKRVYVKDFELGLMRERLLDLSLEIYLDKLKVLWKERLMEMLLAHMMENMLV